MSGIVVVGSLNMDIVTHVTAHPQPGETVHGCGTDYHSGGKGANQAVGAARAGAAVRMFGAVGHDQHSRTLMENLQRDCIDVSYVQHVEGPSGTAFIAVSETGENTIIIEPGANGRLTGAMLSGGIDNGLFEGQSTLLVQNEVPAEVSLDAMRRAKASGLHVIFNPAPVQGVALTWLEHVDTVVVNETEAESLTGFSVETPEGTQSAIRRLLNSGARAAIVTLGDRGCVYGTREDSQRQTEIKTIVQSAFRAQAVDTTAAGDTFVGAFAAAYHEEQGIHRALVFASAAAALAVTRHGAQSSIPVREEIERMIAGK